MTTLLDEGRQAEGASIEASAPESQRTSVAPPGSLKICLAGSGGGHVRQLLDLEPVWSLHDFFFATEDSALSRSFAKSWRTYFVEHYALGQARLKSPLAMLKGAWANFISSYRIIAKERPDVVITTGAGAVFFCVLLARLRGAKIVMIESFARFDRPSMFTRITQPLAHRKIVQSAALAKFMPDAKVFDPLKIVDSVRPVKRPLVFATVGATLPFDRLVKSVAALKAAGEVPEDILIQTGVGGYRPEGIETAETLDFGRVQNILREADIVVCHGGTGSLITALRQGCRTIVMPRLPALGEHYDNHQADITKSFAARGLVTIANTTEELSAAFKIARSRAPVSATTDPAKLIEYLHSQLSGWASDKLSKT